MTKLSWSGWVVFNQPPRPTQPGHPSEVGKMSIGVKTGKVTAGYAVNLQHWVNLAPLYGCLYYRAELRVLCCVHNIWSFVCSIIMYCPAWQTLGLLLIVLCSGLSAIIIKTLLLLQSWGVRLPNYTVNDNDNDNDFIGMAANRLDYKQSILHHCSCIQVTTCRDWLIRLRHTHTTTAWLKVSFARFRIL